MITLNLGDKMQSKLSLDHEYSPSLHTRRFQECAKPNESVINNFIEITKAETCRVRAKYKIRENVRYGLDDNQLLDIYYKDQENDTPIFVYIHGGFWQALDKGTAGSFVEPLVERGYRVVLVDYNLCPEVSLDQLTQQICQFYEWLYHYAEETNASKISFCGHSAGAHLVTFLFKSTFFHHMASKIESCFLISGIYDLHELRQLESANPDNILGLDVLKACELSPLCWNLDEALIKFCKDAKLKFHILVADNDSATFKQQSQAYAQKLQQIGLYQNFQIFENYDHFDIIEEVPRENSAINRYILENL